MIALLSKLPRSKPIPSEFKRTETKQRMKIREDGGSGHTRSRGIYASRYTPRAMRSNSGSFA